MVRAYIPPHVLLHVRDALISMRWPATARALLATDMATREFDAAAQLAVPRERIQAAIDVVPGFRRMLASPKTLVMPDER